MSVKCELLIHGIELDELSFSLFFHHSIVDVSHEFWKTRGK